MSHAGPAVNVPPPIPLKASHWLILTISVIGFAFDTYALLVMPIVARPALSELLQVDPDTASGTQEILKWTGYIMWGSALCGGAFGLVGGYLTDWLGRRRMLTWSILLYAFSALASGFATSAPMFLVLRCATFIGVCLEFVAAVAWLAELFPNPHQRESVLGYTQAFSSLGGLLVTGSYALIVRFIDYLPAVPFIDEPSAWRYTLISGVIPAIPLIFIRPFLPESPAWQTKARGRHAQASELWRAIPRQLAANVFGDCRTVRLRLRSGFWRDSNDAANGARLVAGTRAAIRLARSLRRRKERCQARKVGQ